MFNDSTKETQEILKKDRNLSGSREQGGGESVADRSKIIWRKEV